MNLSRLAIVTTTALAAAMMLAPTANASSPVLLGDHVVPHGYTYANTTVGGLSSIDFDPRSGEFAMISDDRSEVDPARYYTARIGFDAAGVHHVEFTGVHEFRRPDGSTYPTLDQWRQGPRIQPYNVNGVVDPEELRYDPRSSDVTWTSEGERLPGDVMLDPAVRSSHRDGRYHRELAIPANERMSTGAWGPRRNQTLEGLTYAADGALVATAMEDPLIQDGENPTVAHGALTRFTLSTRQGQPVAQYVYPLDPLFVASSNAEDTNGVSAMVAVDRFDPTRYLAVERAYVSGVGNKIRIYEFTTAGAQNVLHRDRLDHPRPMRKKLLVDLDTVGLSRVDNVEGITFGPRLSDGRRTLLLVSDNNFSPHQITQIIALAL